MNRSFLIQTLIFIFEKLIVFSYCMFLIVAPYETKWAGKIAFSFSMAMWFFILVFSYKWHWWRYVLPPGSFYKPLAFFVSACACSIVFSLYPYESQAVFFDRYLVYFVFFLLGAWVCGASKSNRYALVFSLLVSIFIFSIGGVWDYFYYSRNNPSLCDRLWSVFGRRIPYYGFPMYLSFFVPFSFAFFVYAKTKAIKVIAFMNLVFSVLCLIWSASRGAWVAVGISMLVVSSLNVKKKLFSAGLITALLVLLFVILGSQSSTITQRIETTFIPSEWSNRLPLYKSAVKIFLDHPITGSGIGTFGKILPRVQYALPVDYPVAKELNLHAHNTYLEVSAEMGLLGLISFLYVFAVFFKKALGFIVGNREKKDEDIYAVLIALTSAVFSVLIFAFSSSIITVGVNSAVYFWLLFAMAAGILSSQQLRKI